LVWEVDFQARDADNPIHLGVQEDPMLIEAGIVMRQAQIVLLKKLGVHVDTSGPDLEIERKFKATFRGGNMSANKQQALQILFNNDFDPMAMGLDMAELDAVET